MNKAPEHELQKHCVTWFKYRYPHLKALFFSVPNGGVRNKAEAGKLKAEGTNRGVADLILLLPNYYFHSLNIEMKAGSSQSDYQKIYEQACRASGSNYVVCRSLDHFKDVIQEYLSSVDVNIISSLRTLHAAVEEAKVQQAREQYRKLKNKTNHEEK